MARTTKTVQRRGIALVATLIFVMVFMAMSVGMMTMSSHNMLAAANLQAGNLARSTAESGLEMVRYWMQDISVPATTSESARHGVVLSRLCQTLDDANISYVLVNSDTLKIGSAESPIAIDEDAHRSFYAVISKDNAGGTPYVQIVGIAGALSRRIDVGFTYGTRPHTVFDYGVATKGPLMLLGNTALDGVNISSESDVFIESLDEDYALSVEGNSQIAGKVNIVNPDAYVTIKGGQSSIGGEKGSDALNHVTTGAAMTEFPYPDAAYFEQYATGGDYSSGTTLENVVIKAGTNPSFTSNVTIKGVLYVESPNVVDFGGNVNITGLIVGDGDMHDHSQDNQMIFRGNVSSQGVADLDASFGDLRNETGTFLMAPGFFLSFGGNFGTVNGAIIGNGIEFFGNAGGTVEGSVINYSPTPMTVTGNSDLYFNRSGITKIPAGFVQELLVYYAPVSYKEIAAY